MVRCKEGPVKQWAEKFYREKEYWRDDEEGKGGRGQSERRKRRRNKDSASLLARSIVTAKLDECSFGT